MWGMCMIVVYLGMYTAYCIDGTGCTMAGTWSLSVWQWLKSSMTLVEWVILVDFDPAKTLSSLQQPLQVLP